MVAYSFKAQFREPILAGTKRQTLRNERRRHARSGEELQLYTGMRTRQCALIGRVKCWGVSNIRIDFEHGRVESLDTGRAWTTLDDLNAFALRDGFASWSELRQFWLHEHGLRDASRRLRLPAAWTGVMISWFDVPKADPQ